MFFLLIARNEITTEWLRIPSIKQYNPQPINEPSIKQMVGRSVFRRPGHTLTYTLGVNALHSLIPNI